MCVHILSTENHDMCCAPDLQLHSADQCLDSDGAKLCDDARNVAHSLGLDTGFMILRGRVRLGKSWFSVLCIVLAERVLSVESGEWMTAGLSPGDVDKLEKFKAVLKIDSEPQWHAIEHDFSQSRCEAIISGKSCAIMSQALYEELLPSPPPELSDVPAIYVYLITKKNKDACYVSYPELSEVFCQEFTKPLRAVKQTARKVGLATHIRYDDIRLCPGTEPIPCIIYGYRRLNKKTGEWRKTCTVPVSRLEQFKQFEKMAGITEPPRWYAQSNMATAFSRSLGL
ncbi:hypothetical protein K488DRAFT_87316 [Vararia minispora EC-137]|uniref:Uncharacterized protein n=1 Tax=Vararia minispora EC-137 TaxID=1314806 RepID=A0ACB8QGN5_9AGAM|nr:hypothetical protein K488DRAFT_87316 [Vararia minispora EC-137]